MTDVKPEQLTALQEFFKREVAKKGTEPLRNGIEIAIYVDGAGPVNLTKLEGTAQVLPSPPKKANMTFHVPGAALKTLCASDTTDVGEIGVVILQLMAASEESERVKAKVHIGLFDLLRNGYLGVIPLGGPTVMKFLASKGFNGMGKIKDAISRLRE